MRVSSTVRVVLLPLMKSSPMVYRRVVMVRLILMFMLRYFWVSEGADKVDGLVGFLLHDADDFWG